MSARKRGFDSNCFPSKGLANIPGLGQQGSDSWMAAKDPETVGGGLVTLGAVRYTWVHRGYTVGTPWVHRGFWIL